MMRKEDLALIEAYAQEHNIAFQALKDLYELCREIHTSGWCDGSNDYLPWEDEEE